MNQLPYVLIFGVLMALTSCAHQAPPSNKTCITEKEFEARKASATEIAIRISDTSKQPEWRVLEKGCYKTTLVSKDLQFRKKANIVTPPLIDT